MTDTLAYIALGSNLGHRLANIRCAIARMSQTEGILSVTQSPLSLETEPQDCLLTQGFYLNTVAQLKTQLSPDALLDACLDIEQAMGRLRQTAASGPGPRVIDLDLIAVLQNGVSIRVVQPPKLVLPHPRAYQREFVMRPLAAMGALDVLTCLNGL
ncbi:MAG: 2-amino-4-hydroxy-6-hydroxymethyldihydropteridine diphosphokinase [Vampirovibrionales bacterium]|nr:2-amino-4-hydroxy-6-hydroxymethyldihydropteridine diphosphokinase [Vampirovibrionales bacterium]